MSAQPRPGRRPARPRPATPKLKPVPSPATRRPPSRRAVPASRPVPSPLRARRRPLAFLVFATAVIGTLVLGLTALNAVMAQGSFRIADLSQRVDRLHRELERKQLDVARLSAPGRISRLAAGLGMVEPKPRDVRVIHVRGTSAGPSAAKRRRATGNSG